MSGERGAKETMHAETYARAFKIGVCLGVRIFNKRLVFNIRLLIRIQSPHRDGRNAVHVWYHLPQNRDHACNSYEGFADEILSKPGKYIFHARQNSRTKDSPENLLLSHAPLDRLEVPSLMSLIDGNHGILEKCMGLRRCAKAHSSRRVLGQCAEVRLTRQEIRFQLLDDATPLWAKYFSKGVLDEIWKRGGIVRWEPNAWTHE